MQDRQACQWQASEVAWELSLKLQQLLYLTQFLDFVDYVNISHFPRTKGHKSRFQTLDLRWLTIIGLGLDKVETRLYTQQDGWCWFFGAVDHYTNEVVGWHVAKLGDRWAALEPIRQGVRYAYGTFARRVGRSPSSSRATTPSG